MKALIITPCYPVPDYPQMGIFVHRQVVNLVRQGIECRVLVYRPGPQPFPLWLRRRSWLRYYWRGLRWPNELEGVPVSHIFYRRLGTPNEDVIPAIGDALVQFVEHHPECLDTDLVYAHWLWSGGASALALRDRFGWPVVAIARGSEMHDWQLFRPHCRPYVERVLREADCILANCEDLRGRAEALVPGSAARIDVVYNGCDAEEFRPALNKVEVRQALKLDPDSKLLLFCGDITERKGIVELAAVWKSFSATHPDWKLVIVGQAVDPALTARLREAGNGRILFTGPLPHRKVISHMQAADAYIQPSRLEGLSNATMEAMAIGLPVITTDTCGQRELIQDGENGWLVPPGDESALQRALESLVRNLEQARRMGEAARLTIKTRFNPQKEATRLADLLRNAGHQGTLKHNVATVESQSRPGS